VTVRAALAAIILCGLSVNVRAAPDGMEQPHIDGQNRPLINIEHACPFQGRQNAGHAAFQFIHKAGLVLPIVEGNIIAHASYNMRGKELHFDRRVTGFPRFHKIIDLRSGNMFPDRDLFSFAGKSV
jgi:hypothetical protein